MKILRVFSVFIVIMSSFGNLFGFRIYNTVDFPVTLKFDSFVGKSEPKSNSVFTRFSPRDKESEMELLNADNKPITERVLGRHETTRNYTLNFDFDPKKYSPEKTDYYFYISIPGVEYMNTEGLRIYFGEPERTSNGKMYSKEGINSDNTKFKVISDGQMLKIVDATEK